MKPTLTAQQLSYYTQHGFIELELPLDLPNFSSGRDLWRNDPKIKSMILQKIAPLALSLTKHKQIRLGLDTYLDPIPKKAGPVKGLFSIQGFAIGAILRQDGEPIGRKSNLGLLPYPSNPGSILFFKPELILDWPHTPSPVYMVLFTKQEAVYIHNPDDPHTNELKHMGYAFGDLLKNSTHPLIFS